MPVAGEHVWFWFWDLNRGRQVGMNGWLPLSATELKAWESMTGNIVRREEWQIIRDMDGTFLAAMSPKENGALRSSSVEMTAGAFDAMFA